MHIDEFIEDKTQDPYARDMFDFFRGPCHGMLNPTDPRRNRKLFCTYEGKRYRVTGASRLGDVFLQPDFDKDYGYKERVDVEDCSAWSACR